MDIILRKRMRDGIFFFFAGRGGFPCRIMTRFEKAIHVLGTICILNQYHVYMVEYWTSPETFFTLKCCLAFEEFYSHFFCSEFSI